MKTFKGRVVAPGTVTAKALVSHGGLNTLASFQKALQFGDKNATSGDQNNPDLYGKQIRNMVVRSMEEMEQFIKDNAIDIAVLTIPKNGAVAVAEKLVKCDIKAIWTFAHVDLNVPKHIQVENVHLSESLMKLSYKLSK